MSKINGIFEKLKLVKRENSSPLNSPIEIPSVSGVKTTTRSSFSLQEPNKTFKVSQQIKSRIAQTLSEVVNDSTALSYFINFLESLGRLNLLKFWLHTENFKISCQNLPTSSQNDEKTLKKLKDGIIADAESIYNTYIDSTSLLNIGISPRSRNLIKKNLNDINNFSSMESIYQDFYKCFDEVQDFVWDILSNRYFKDFLHSHIYSNYNLEMIERFGLSLEDILRSHSLLCSFIEFLDQFESRKFLEFVIAVDSFIAELNQIQSNQLFVVVENEKNFVTNIQEDAMVIYDRYFSMQATDPLEFGDEIRIEVETKICTDDGLPCKDVFDRSRQMAANLLQQQLIPMFVDSPYFLKIIDVWKLSMENHPSNFNTALQGITTNNFHRLSNASSPPPPFNSECDNEEIEEDLQSCSSSAGFVSSFRTRSLTGDTNPDENFKNEALNRSKKPALKFASDVSFKGGKNTTKCRLKTSSLAKVDQFGRYTSLFDNTLIHAEDINSLSTRNKLKNTLDKYLNQTAAKESLVADEVAQLIIGDIQKMVAVGNTPNRS